MKAGKFAKLLVLCLIAATCAHAADFTDDFNSPFDYLSQSPHKNNWDGIVGLTDLYVEQLNANLDLAGQLLLKGQLGFDMATWTCTGPFLYKYAEGDFTAIVKITEYQEIPNNDCGIIAIVHDQQLAGSGQDWISINYFPFWDVGNAVRQCNDSFEEEICNNGLGFSGAAFMKMQRIGNDFHFEYSFTGDQWIPMSCSPITRDDFNGLPLQVGLFQGTYTGLSGYAAFDNFQLDTSPNTHALAPVPFHEQADVTADANLNWLPGTGTRHDIFIAKDYNSVSQDERLTADINGDTRVSENDLQYINQQWLSGDFNDYNADLNNDKNVNMIDFALFASQWKNSSQNSFAASTPIDSNSFDPIDFDTPSDYYWRIDAVNEIDRTYHKGYTWRFKSQ